MVKLVMCGPTYREKVSEGCFLTSIEDLLARRKSEQLRIRMLLDARKSEDQAKLKGGEDAVAWVKEEQCIGCDQCTLVCEDDAIELYDTPLASPILNIEVNRKAKILRDPCTGCQLCFGMPDRCYSND